MIYVSIGSAIVALTAAVIAFCSEPIRRWWNRTSISLVLEKPEKEWRAWFGCVYWPGHKNAWVRLRVVNRTKRLAKSCQPFLTHVAKMGSNRQWWVIHSDMLPLQWAFRHDERAIDIPGELESFCDVLLTQEGVPHFHPSTTAKMMDGNWERLLNEPGDYRLTVTIGGDNMAPHSVCLYVRWTGKWNDFEIGTDDEKDMIHVLLE